MPGQARVEALRSPTRKGLGSRTDLSFAHRLSEIEKIFSHKPHLHEIDDWGFRRRRIPFLQREKAAYLILRRVGLSINQISEAFGRSCSVVHRVLKKARYAGHNLDVWCRRLDIRKLPYKARMRAASFRWFQMLKLLSAWESWICGEGEEPP